jgi:hypothetical protein
MPRTKFWDGCEPIREPSTKLETLPLRVVGAIVRFAQIFALA